MGDLMPLDFWRRHYINLACWPANPARNRLKRIALRGQARCLIDMDRQYVGSSLTPTPRPARGTQEATT